MLDFNTFSRDESAFEGKQGDVWFFFFDRFRWSYLRSAQVSYTRQLNFPFF